MAEAQYFITYRVKVKIAETKKGSLPNIDAVMKDIEEKIRKDKRVIDVFPLDPKKVEGY